MKKFDFLLASAMVIIALVWFFINNIYSEDGRTLVVYQGNCVIGTYSLSEDGDYEIPDMISFKIKNGLVDVVNANCKDKLCVHQKPISKGNEMIVCLPNKIVLEISSSNDEKEDSTFDAVTY